MQALLKSQSITRKTAGLIKADVDVFNRLMAAYVA